MDKACSITEPAEQLRRCGHVDVENGRSNHPSNLSVYADTSAATDTTPEAVMADIAR